MVRKYSRLIRERAIYEKTGKIWTINDVPGLWREQTRRDVIEKGYKFLEDGTAVPDESEEEPTA